MSLRALLAIASLALASACSVYLDESLLSAGNADAGGTSAATGDDAGAPATSDTSTSTSAAPVLTALSPNHAAAGSPDLAITATGTGFDASSTIVADGVSLTTAFLDETTLSTTIPAAKLAVEGSFPVQVVNAAGQTSAAITFTVTSASITLTSIDPTSATAGSGDTTLHANGSGFATGFVVRFNGVDLATTFGGATQITATIPTSLLSTAGTYPVTVGAPSPSKAAATPIDFTVRNVAPTLTSVAPTTLTALAADTTLTLTGTGFVSGLSVVQSNGVALATTFVSATELTAIIPHAQLVPGKATLTVVNAPPGGGTSAGIDVPIACDSSGVDIPLTATGQPASRSTSLTTQLRSYKDATSCPASFYASLTEASHGWVVQNQTAASALLSAWAVCASANDDAYLTFYRRATVPSSVTDLASCTRTVAEGKNGLGGYASPESNASPWCPGLTKSNGQGVTIGVCEKVVVFMQEYDVGTGPSTMKAQIDPP